MSIVVKVSWLREQTQLLKLHDGGPERLRSWLHYTGRDRVVMCTRGKVFYCTTTDSFTAVTPNHLRDDWVRDAFRCALISEGRLV